MRFLWHSPSEGPLSHPFTNYTHNTSYRPNARGGPSSYFSQSLELCVATSKYLSTQYLTTWDRGIRHFLGLRCAFIRVPSYPTTLVAVSYLVYIYLLYGGPPTRTHRIVNFLVCVIGILGYPVAAIWIPRYSDAHEVLGLRLYTM